MLVVKENQGGMKHAVVSQKKAGIQKFDYQLLERYF